MKTTEILKTAFKERLLTITGLEIKDSTDYQRFVTLASLVRDHIGSQWLETMKRHDGKKQAYYFSIEFLPGRLLDANLRSLDLLEDWQAALTGLGLDYEQIINAEQDASLGNGGLGRLASCFLESFAGADLPAHGCGIRYTFGLFKQTIVDGEQKEEPDSWVNVLSVWEYRKESKAVNVNFAHPLGTVRAVPYDVPIVGYKNGATTNMRLWSAEMNKNIDINYSDMNPSDYRNLLEYKSWVEAISKVLYPDDRHDLGRKMRLVQEYFLASAGVQSIVRHAKKVNGPDLSAMHEKVAIHINDTHPALVIPELMRILLDEEGMSWEAAWHVTSNTVSYTNHTVMPEALEEWPVEQIRRMVPRIYEIIHEINERFCYDLWQKYPGDWDRIAAMAIVADGKVKMAHLAIAGSHSVNGVSALHSSILQKSLMKLFYDYSSTKFNNKTNGISHRRWLLGANPELAELINQTIGGQEWIHKPECLRSLLPYAREMSFVQEFSSIKQNNKNHLANYVAQKYDIKLDPNSIFDVHVKRIHIYKRQMLKILHILDLYNRLKENPQLNIAPRTFIFAGKAAPGYYLAKKIIHLINVLATHINKDKTIKNKIKIVFMENYNVSLAQLIIPAADISEQISTAGKEASGTGNMKFMMNGAITVGTLDGANVEIREAVSDKNIFIFGLNAQQAALHKELPLWYYQNNERLQKAVDGLINGKIPHCNDEFKPLYEHLLYSDGQFLELADFAAYIEAQDKVSKLFCNNNQARWQMAIANVAYSGQFSADRTVNEYAEEIWRIK